MPCTTVLLGDDHGVVRQGLRRILEDEVDLKVVGEASNGRECAQEAERIQPDVVLMDISMPELNGIEATRIIKERCPGARVIILSMHQTAEYVVRALRAGASGYILKEALGQEVVEAIRAVRSGKRYLSSKITDVAIEDWVMQPSMGSGDSLLDRLSVREREVLQLVAEGKSSKEIADMIHLSPKTVETYRSRLMEKLGVGNLAELVRFAVEHGIVSFS